MPIFPVLELESIVQEKDKTRLNAEKSYAVGTDVISKIEICPNYTGVAQNDTFYDVTTAMFLDWQYDHSGGQAADPETFTVAVRLTDTVVPPENATTQLLTKTIQVITAATDKLFSTDDKLRQHESDILKNVADGRATFKDVHRRVQSLVLAWLDTQGFTDAVGLKFTKARIVDIEEVTEWATAMALRLIFEGILVSKDDVYSLKAKKYLVLEEFYRNRAVLRIDINEDGAVSRGEQIDTRSAVVVRR